MATNTLQTRIRLKYDTHANWIANDPVLLSGEYAVDVIPVNTGVAQNEPAVLIKVGNGTAKFSELPYVSALAADVYAWAKAATKPTYTAAEISDLEEYIKGEIQDTNTRYQLVQSGDMGLQLQSSQTGTAPWTNVGTVITFDPTANIKVALEALDLATVTAGQGQIIGSISQANGVVTAATRALVAADIPEIAQSQVTGLTTALTGKQDTLVFDGIYNAETNKVATVSTVTSGMTTVEDKLTGNNAGINATTIKGAVVEANAYTDTQIAAKLGAVYKPVGSVTFAQLPKELTAEMVGNVYNVTDSFEASALFVTGEVGNTYPAGSNVAVVKDNGSYYYDVLSGVVDLTAYATTEFVNTSITTTKNDLIGTGETITATTIKGAVTEAKNYADSLNSALTEKVTALETAVGETPVATQITNAIGALDKADEAVAGQFVTAVSETDGIITVTRAALSAANIPEIGQDKVTGLTDALNAKANTADLAAIATTGNANDLVQTAGEYLILNCGSSSTVI